MEPDRCDLRVLKGEVNGQEGVKVLQLEEVLPDLDHLGPGPKLLFTVGLLHHEVDHKVDKLVGELIG